MHYMKTSCLWAALCLWNVQVVVSNCPSGDSNCDGAAVVPYSFDEPTFFGSGCPEGSVEIIQSGDGQTVSVLFSEYISETSLDTTRARLSCNLAVPVDVAAG